MSYSAIILAGGLGKRMNSEIPKVCHKVYEKPMIQAVYEKLVHFNISDIGIVVGKYKNVIKTYLENPEKLQYLNQEVALGTGHAVQCGISQLKTEEENVIILSGDAPFISRNTLKDMINNFNGDAMLLTCSVKDPHGYGRIIVEDDEFKKIVEEKDCNNEERKVNIINAGVYIFRRDILREYVFQIDNNNVQNEYYLTDIFEILKNDNKKIITFNIDDENEIFNINDQNQLQKANSLNLEYLL